MRVRLCRPEPPTPTSTQGQANIVPHIIQRILNPCSLSQTASYDVADTDRDGQIIIATLCNAC